MVLARSVIVLVATSLAGGALFFQPAAAANRIQAVSPQACGTVLLAGSSWLGGKGVDVKSNGPDQGTGTSCGGTNTVNGIKSGHEWQCTELVNRLYITQGWIIAHWPGNGGRSSPKTLDSMYDEAPSPLSKQPNGSISYLAPGDAVSINVYHGGAFQPDGHVLIVNGSGPVPSGSVSLVSQNGGDPSNATVTSSATLSGGTLSIPASGSWTYQVIGVVHAPQSTPPPAAPVITDTGGDQTNDVSITWTEPGGESGISGFSVYRDGQQIGSVPGTELSYDDTALPDGGDLSYQVLAVGSGGSSALSSQVTVPYLPPGQSGLGWVSTKGHVDYCRRVGGVNNESSHVTCTPFSGSSFGTTETSGVLDWGYGVGRAWVNAGKNLDYCRRVGGVNNQSSYIACTPFNGTRFGATIRSPRVLDWGYDQGAAWVPTSAGADYCRRVGAVNNQSSYIACTPFNGTRFGATIRSPRVVDWGYDVAATWVPTKTGADYCRRVGGVNNQSSYIACTPFNGTRFGATIRSPRVLDWGYDQGAAWVPTSAGADYCRRVGAVNNQSSYIACTPFNGTRFGATIRSPHVVDWGYDN